MPRRKKQHTLEEEEEFQQQQRKRNAENQHRRHHNATKIKNIQKSINYRNHITCVTGTIHHNRVIELDKEITGESSRNTVPICQKNFIEYQSHYRLRKKNLHPVNYSSTMSVNDVIEYYIGAMDVNCIHCNAKHFAAEKVSNRGNSFHDCCNHGAVYLESLPELPQFLYDLFNENHVKSNNFFHRIRSYNSSFSFASFNANLIKF